MEKRNAARPVALLEIGFETTGRNHHDRRRNALLARAQDLEQRFVLGRTGRDMGVDDARTDTSVGFQDLIDRIEIAPIHE